MKRNMTKIRFVSSNIMCVVMCGVFGACDFMILSGTYIGTHTQTNYVSHAAENMIDLVLFDKRL